MKKNLRNKLTVDPPPLPPFMCNAGRRLENNNQLTNGGGTSIIFLLVLALIACKNNDTAHEQVTYTCPMHPTVVSDRPGTCPVCGMDLVRKAGQGEEVEITEDLAGLLKSPNESVVAAIKTIKGHYKSVKVSVQAQGVVTYDTRNIYTIPARAGGRLERVYLKYEFQSVSKGQKIAEIYSPELIATQRELLFLLENDPENKALINGAKRKLELLGFSNFQINDLIKRKVTSNTFSIYSPYSGYLIADTQSSPVTSVVIQSASGSNGMADGMRPTSSLSPAMSSSSENTATTSIMKEGNYVAAGQTLFSIVNATALRIELDLPGAFAGTVKEGSKVELNFGGGKNEAATVDFVQPFFSQGQDFLKIRVYANQTEGLHIGHLVNATINLEPKESLWVPKEAVLDLGLQKVVFLKERGSLKPTSVLTGISADGLIEIRSGLASSDDIAANAQYLVDSESFVKPVN